jgi:hypothetical protein
MFTLNTRLAGTARQNNMEEIMEKIIPYTKESVDKLRDEGYHTVWVDADEYGDGTICMSNQRKDPQPDDKNRDGTPKYSQEYINWRWGGRQGEILRAICKQ